jgi:hypothetical protein
MSNDDLKSKVEFVEKMKRENPKAFEFLGRGASNLLANLEEDLKQELFDWFGRALTIIAPQNIRIMLQTLLQQMECEE